MGDADGSTAMLPAEQAAAPVRGAPRACERCGESLPLAARFCPRCGEQAAVPVEQSAPVERPAAGERPSPGEQAAPGQQRVAPPPEPPVPAHGAVEPRRRRRLLVAVLAIAMAAVAAVAAVVLLGRGDEPPEVRTPAAPAMVSRADAQDVADRYAAAHSAEDVAALDALLAPSFEKRTQDGLMSRSAALAAYAQQFERLSDVSYTLTTQSITPRRGGASVAGRYSITSAEETATGLIRFELVARGGDLLISRITTISTGGERIEPTPTPTPEPDAGADSDTGSDDEGTTTTYAQTARIKTWWNGEFVHFKAVDEATGLTVDEALGSDDVDLADELAALEETPERRALVDKLRAQLRADGWEEIGRADGGEWYELRFGR